MSLEEMPDVFLTILIVNYNGKKFLGPCIDSIEKYVEDPYEIIIVDNASQDGSVDYLKQNHPEVKLIVSQINSGFTGGNNLAAMYARGRYLLLLNNDTVLRSSISPLIVILENKKDVGVLGGRLFYGDGRQQESAGYMPSILSLVFSWTPLMHLFPQVALFRRTISANSNFYRNTFSNVDWVSGAFLLTRSVLWRNLGGFDLLYFMYMEDTDYCRRVWESGYSVAYSSSSEITHYEGAGRSWVGERAITNTTQSYLVYSKKYNGILGQVLLRILLSPVFIARCIAFGIVGGVRIEPDGLAKARAYGLATLKLIGLMR